MRDQASHGGNHSPPSIAEVRNEWSCTSTPAVCLHGFDYQRCCLHIRENFSTLFLDAGIVLRMRSALPKVTCHLKGSVGTQLFFLSVLQIAREMP